MAKPNILQIAPTPFFSDRGCHIRIEGIVRCLDQLGFNNTVCTYHHGHDVDTVSTRRIKTIKAYTQTEAGPSKYKLWADWRLLWLSFKAYRELKPVAIHAHLHEGLAIGLAIKLLFFWRRTPLIGDIQGSLSGELEAHGSFTKKPFLRWPVRFIEKLLVNCANHLVCSSAHSLKQLTELGVRANKLSLAQDGADSASTISEEGKQQLRNELKITAEKPLVVYSGALLESKGLDHLKEVISHVAGQLHFLIIGYPIDDLRSFLQKQELESSCTLTGRIAFEQLSQYLQLADIAIEPKKSDSGEGSGKILNYLANGLAVVAFNTKNNREFLPVTTPLAETPKQLGDQLLTLAHDKGLRAELANQNLAHFEEHFSWTITESQLQTVYEQLSLL